MSKRHNYHDLSPEERLRGGRVTRSAYQYAVTWLDDCGLYTQITHVRGMVGYNIYTSEDGTFALRGWRREQQAAWRYIYNLFIRKCNEHYERNNQVLPGRARKRA